jgi:hypothetical protein
MSKMIPEEVFLKIVRSADKAPSGHNTQPWLFAKEEDGICIMPDYSRSLPIADSINRELFISLGCAAETAMIAARFYGYNAQLNNDLLVNQGTIKIILSKNDALEQPELFSYINPRQTTRNLYGDSPISDDDLIKLKPIIKEAGIDLEFIIGQDKINKFLPYILEANTMQMSDPCFKHELMKWLRFSEKEALLKGDGLYAACIGMPSPGKIIGNFIIEYFVTIKSEEKRLQKQLVATNMLVMFTSENNDFLSWIKTGINLQRFALTCTQLGLSHSYVNLPCQISQVRDKMKNDMGLTGFPQLLIRLGYSQKMHFSFRRRVNEVILK